MMRIDQNEQGSPEWLAARLGIPSASMFAKIVTTKGIWSASADAYINQLVAERLTGEREEVFQSHHMLRGTELEPDARDLYSLISDAEVTEVGFCLHDTLSAGCSPDGLIGDEGGLEIKAPAPATHVEYLRGGVLPSKYKQQVMGCLWITGREWWDFVSYHPTMKPLIVRVERDEEYIAALEKCVTKAVNLIEENVEKFFN
jgi:hypothetical protein